MNAKIEWRSSLVPAPVGFLMQDEVVIGETLNYLLKHYEREFTERIMKKLLRHELQ